MILKTIYLFLLGALSFSVLLELQTIRNRTESVAKRIKQLLGVAFVTMVVCILQTLSMNQTLSTLLTGLYYAGIDWLLFCLICFVESYTKMFNRVTGVYYSVMILCCLDTISLAINSVTHHVFKMVKIQDLNFGICYVVSDHELPFYLHLGICYVMAFVIALSLSHKIIRSANFYRKKYYSILVMFIALLLANGVCTYINLPVDISLLFYGAMAIVVCKYALFYVPNEVVERSLSLVVKGMAAAIFAFDVEGKMFFYNDVALEWFLEIEGRNESVNTFFEKWKSDHIVKVEQHESWLENYMINGEERIFDASYNPVHDGQGEYVGSYFALIDRTEEEKKMKEERYRADFDEVTGLYSRTKFYEETRKILRDEPDVKRVMIISDFRDFKLINDLYGREKGNEVLRFQADKMRMMAKAGTVYGHMEADSFAMCLPQNRFNESDFTNEIVEMKKLFDGSLYHLHIHCGVYEIEDNNESIETICDKAYMAVRMISEEYDRFFAYYDKSMMERIILDKGVVADFPRAIQEEEFVIFLQPQVNVTGEVVSAEALVRWMHREKGMVFPGNFIPALERGGLIYQLDSFVWKLAVRQLAKWKENGQKIIPISINISPKDFYYVNVYETLTKLIKEYEVEPKYLNLEITESVLLNRTQKNIEIINQLKEFGFLIELDDFGSGFSSLNMLKNLDVDVIKIDREFLQATENEQRARVILENIIGLSKDLHLEVITEGVETKEQVEMLTEMGCELFQGYYFSKPIDIKTFEEKYM